MSEIGLSAIFVALTVTCGAIAAAAGVYLWPYIGRAPKMCIWERLLHGVFVSSMVYLMIVAMQTTIDKTNVFGLGDWYSAQSKSRCEDGE